MADRYSDSEGEMQLASSELDGRFNVTISESPRRTYAEVTSNPLRVPIPQFSEMVGGRRGQLLPSRAFQLLEYQWREGKFDTLGKLVSAHRADGLPPYMGGVPSERGVEAGGGREGGGRRSGRHSPLRWDFIPSERGVEAGIAVTAGILTKA